MTELLNFSAQNCSQIVKNRTKNLKLSNQFPSQHVDCQYITVSISVL